MQLLQYVVNSNCYLVTTFSSIPRLSPNGAPPRRKFLIPVPAPYETSLAPPASKAQPRPAPPGGGDPRLVTLVGRMGIVGKYILYINNYIYIIYS